MTVERDNIYKSWLKFPFDFIEEDSRLGKKGLRKPQIAALHMALAHLTVSPLSPATIVMPTGTGKTDTISALIIAGRFERTLIVVPSDTLRTQTCEKLEKLEVLRRVKSLHKNIKSPKVKTIDSNLEQLSILSLDEYNVIITTPQALNLFQKENINTLASLCSHLIIDEAHHVAAKSWDAIKKIFKEKPCIQFTATPFREDKKSLEGKIIYNYSLKEAQEDGYFQEIEFHPVREYQPEIADKTIADKAVELLREDLSSGKNHILLARTKTQAKAKAIFDLYNKHKDLNPVIIHSNIANKKSILEKIKRKEHKIIVCVDMLGEGFDLPELKIAAIHDQHKSPAITLQFIGRLTRVSQELGTAKFVANIANQNTEFQLEKLYEENADWSSIIRDVSSSKINKEIKKQELASLFDKKSDGERILSLNPSPKISATAYKLNPENWQPELITNFKSSKEKAVFSSISKDSSIAILVTKSETRVSWANTEEIYNTEWHLYLAYYDLNTKTLFIHSSNDETKSQYFCKLLTTDAKKISGEQIFRSLYEIKRLKLQSVGLSRSRRDLRFTMHVGTDINAVISEIEKNTSKKSNIFSTGYEEGLKTTIGCSHKGKLWQMDTQTIDHWVSWCSNISQKINDESIQIEHILKNTMRSKKIEFSWPENIFFADWPDNIHIEKEQKIALKVKGLEYNLLDLQLRHPRVASSSNLVIDIYAETQDENPFKLLELSIILLDDYFEVECLHAKICFGKTEINLESYLQENPLIFLCQNGSYVEGNYIFYNENSINVRIPKEFITSWDWKGIDISKESMGKDKKENTVQGFTFEKISENYDIVFNDDGNGEIADLVAIREEPEKIKIDLYHCKYCSKNSQKIAIPGGRVEDTYEVSGQASRSVKWVNTESEFFSQLLRRYQKKIASGFDRMLKGDIKDIDILRLKCRHLEMNFGFYIVQPAISISKISEEQRAVLGTSYTYIKDTTGVDLKIIGSE